jgi:hypothetical protein
MVIMIAMAAIQNHDDSCDGDHVMMMMTVMPMMMIMIDKIPTTAKITMMREPSQIRFS